MKRMFSLMLVLAMILAVCSACGSGAVSSAPSAAAPASAEEASAAEPAVEEPPAEEAPAAEEPAEEAASDAEEAEEAPVVEEKPLPDDAVTLPLDETKTLTFWHDAGNDVLNALPNADYNEQPGMRHAEEVTGVHIDNRTSSPMEQATDFQLMVASGDFTDLMYSAASFYSGGGTAAVEDGVILDLAPYVEEGYLPNYEKAFSITEKQAADIRTDDGYITTFLRIYENGPDPAGGMWIRKDYLDKVGKDVPETYDELHEVLLAFKNDLGLEEAYYTYIFGDSHLTEGYGVASELADNESFDSDMFFQKDGEAHYAPLEPEWKEVITMMSQWYSEGLFGTDLANHSINASDAGFGQSVCTGKCGVFRCGTRMIDMVSGNGVDYDPDFELVAMADVTRNKDDMFHYTWPTRGYATSGICVAETCEDIPLALAWCDFWYTEEGSIIAQYGEEGVTYEMVNGKPEWTEYITNNPNGTPIVTAQSLYQLYVGSCYPVTTDTTGWPQRNIDALETWSRKWDAAYAMPDTLSLTADEASVFASKYSEIATYYGEMLARFISGQEPMSNYDTFRQNLIDMGAEDLIAIEQDALERYNNR